MKKLFSLALTIFMLVGCFNLTALADETTEATETAEVYVTIANAGKLEVAQEKVTVTDVDEDGALTINDTLVVAHDVYYEGGAEAGYASANTDYGLSIAKLWGDTSGSFGYYVNHASAWSLADVVEDGDYVNAFVYKDAAFWSDTYCYFDVNTTTGTAGEDITVTLSMAGYDANWNPIVLPAADATITVNGETTDVKTDAEGKATIQIAQGGTYVISATSDTMTLVPPVCVATVASTDTAKDYVTISDAEGKLALAQKEILVSDTDKDGYLTINDALYAAHEANFEGGAAAGYGSYYGSYGLSMSKLWGTDNGGSYGYHCVGNRECDNGVRIGNL